jgi:hypothetical protein
MDTPGQRNPCDLGRRRCSRLTTPFRLSVSRESRDCREREGRGGELRKKKKKKNK